ncbi:helix-turn-helix transcriptional regulator [Rhodoferax sp. TH121]|uniref:helix-turn-helix transcriptional regulator n=1 Tax=Rhodoferax sp. TH121 TaxID=2022803 RepID=UPI0020CD468D|nr:XRE family transcriptional regulator [Rhodoferax sp. TH121]
MPVQTTKPSDYPQAVVQQIALLAQNIVIARKRRKETQAQWAKRLGVSQPTMARIERGDPSVAMASYVMCMWLINPSATLADLIAPQQDHAALEREILRVQPQHTVPHTYATSPATHPPRMAEEGRAQVAAGLAALIAPPGRTPAA